MNREQAIAYMLEREVKRKSLTGEEYVAYVCNTPYIPLAVAYGMGVDSTALLIEMHRRGIRPDLIIFSNVGSEKPQTYAYMKVISEWLKDVGFPPVTVVKRNKGRVSYDTLHGECLTNRTLPAISVGMKSCSIKWKIEPFNQYMHKWGPAIRCWQEGCKVVKIIGYDAGPSDGRRILNGDGTTRLEDDKFYLWYPLIDWKLDREACKQVIRDAGLPVPVKSACFMCGSMREREIDLLSQQHPDLLEVALKIEDMARPRLTRRPRYGLNRRFSWRQYLTLRDRQTSFLSLMKTSLPVVHTNDYDFVCPGV